MANVESKVESKDPGQAVMAFIRSEIASDAEPFDFDANLLMEVGVDSLGLLRLVAYIEQTFNIPVPPAQFTIENFRSVQTISGFIQRQIAERSAT